MHVFVHGSVHGSASSCCTTMICGMSPCTVLVLFSHPYAETLNSTLNSAPLPLAVMSLAGLELGGSA
eukprot:scaffold18337_cov33-Tisochrysis_lutea.AAC.1